MDQLLSYLAFANDLVLFAETEWGLKQQIKLVVELLAKCGIHVNASKCGTMVYRADTQRKRGATLNRSIAEIDGVPIPAIGPDDAYKYLGLQVTSSGTQAQVEAKVKFQLTELTQAPLKPLEQLAITQSNIIPGVYDQLVLAKTSIIRNNQNEDQSLAQTTSLHG